jgi:hypothetical protein
MKLHSIIAILMLVGPGCGKDDKEAPTPSTEQKPAPPPATPPDPAAAEAVAQSKKDLEEVKGDIAKGSYSMACGDLMRRNPEIEKVDKALAAEVDKTCNVDLPVSVIEQAVKAVEDEAAEMAKKPNKHDLKRVNSRCPNAQLKQAREKLEAANKVDDALRAKLARYDELCK